MSIETLFTQINAVLKPFDDANLQSEIDSIDSRRNAWVDYKEANKASIATTYYSGLFAAVGGKGWYELLNGNSHSMIIEKLTKKHNATVAARNAKIAKKFDSLEINEVTTSESTYSNGNFFGTWVLNTNKGKKVIEIEVIVAGGYNIQCMHNRVLCKVK
jgi:hypothetical protein